MPYADPEKKRQFNAMYKEKHRAHLLAYYKEYRLRHLGHIREVKKAYNVRNRERRTTLKREWRHRNPERARLTSHEQYYRNPAKANAAVMVCYWRDRDKAIARCVAYARRRYQGDPIHALIMVFRARIGQILRTKSNRRAIKTVELIGCTAMDLRSHLEAQFLVGMTWENRALWNIDHIRPCASFDLTDPEQLRACFHYTNLQPLWSADNRRKGAKYEGRSWRKTNQH